MVEKEWKRVIKSALFENPITSKDSWTLSAPIEPPPFPWGGPQALHGRDHDSVPLESLQSHPSFNKEARRAHMKTYSCYEKNLIYLALLTLLIKTPCHVTQIAWSQPVFGDSTRSPDNPPREVAVWSKNKFASILLSNGWNNGACIIRMTQMPPRRRTSC